MKRTIIFGDIHGCYREWQDLLDKLAVTSNDELISVGDLICKGPSTKKVLDMAMSMKNLSCVLGNHEVRFLKCWEKGQLPDIKPYDKTAVEDMGKNFEKYMNFIKTWPYYIEKKDFIVVHSGLRQGKPLDQQNLDDLTNIRTVPPDDKPWFDYYEGEKTIIHGHWARLGLVERHNTIGLDSGCVYGKKLSAVVLPERKIVQVNAKKVYSPIHKKG